MTNQERLYEELNTMLEGATSKEDLEAIIERVENEEEHPIYFIMKRSDVVVSEFILREGSTRTQYLLEDGTSTRNSEIKNLHRNIIIGE